MTDLFQAIVLGFCGGFIGAFLADIVGGLFKGMNKAKKIRGNK